MPVRTSAVVAIGLGFLTVIGVGTIFGDAILAVVAPPPIESTPAPVRPNAAAGDAGIRSASDGSS